MRIRIQTNVRKQVLFRQLTKTRTNILQTI